MLSPHSPSHSIARSSDGFTLVEVILSIGIVGVLGIALVAAIDASFMAYSTSGESASMQMTGRVVSSRTMNMIRNASLHDAYDPASPSTTLLLPTDANHPLQTVGVQMMTDAGVTVRMWWQVNASYGNANLGDLMYQENAGTAQVLLSRVTCQRTASNAPYLFTLASRTSDAGLLLARATLDLQVQRDPETTTGLEQASGKPGALRIVNSAMPRRNLD